jgi:signal transduction histidine kinase
MTRTSKPDRAAPDDRTGDLEFTYVLPAGARGRGETTGETIPSGPFPDPREGAPEAPPAGEPEALYAAFSHLAASVAHEVRHPAEVVESNARTVAEYASSLGALLKGYEELLEAVTRQDRQHLTEVLRRVKKLRGDEDVAFVLEDLPRLLAESASSTARLQRLGSRLGRLRGVDRDRPDPRELRKLVDEAVAP